MKRVGGAGDDKGGVLTRMQGWRRSHCSHLSHPPPLELSQKEIQDGREALLNPGYFLVLDFRHRLKLAKMNAICIG